MGIFYACKIERTVVAIDSELEFIGVHKKQKTNQDVESIRFIDCTMPRIPDGLTKVFPKLKFLYIKKSKLKSIERRDLKQFTDLRYIWCENNVIEYLLSDLFADHKNLEVIDFSDNMIVMIEPNLFDGLEKLRYVNFNNNILIDEFWDLGYLFKNATLQSIKNEINANFSNLELKKIFDMNRTLKQENMELKKLRSSCTIKNGICEDLKKIIQNDSLKDFTVTVNREKFKVHKFLLAARSPVLKEMIENNIKAESLNLIDISKEIFREILNFIYTDELPQSDEINFIHLYAASERLKIENLRKFAAEKLMNKINNENALEVLTLANKYHNEKLKQKSFEIVKEQLRDETTKIDVNLASNPEKLKKILAMKKKKDEMMKQMSLEFEKLMKEE